MPAVRTDGRSVYGHVITKFSGMGRLHRYGAPSTRARSSAINVLQQFDSTLSLLRLKSSFPFLLFLSVRCYMKTPYPRILNSHKMSPCDCVEMMTRIQISAGPP